MTTPVSLSLTDPRPRPARRPWPLALLAFGLLPLAGHAQTPAATFSLQYSSLSPGTINPNSVAIADVNGDGKPDAIMTNISTGPRPQAPGADPTAVPLDGGASLLLASGVAYGLRRLRKRQNPRP